MIFPEMAVWLLCSVVYSSRRTEKPLWPHSWSDISVAINQWGSGFVCPLLSPDGLPLGREWMRREVERRAKVKSWHLVIQRWGTGIPSGCSASQQHVHIVVVAVDTSQIRAKCTSCSANFHAFVRKKALYHTLSLCINVLKRTNYGGAQFRPKVCKYFFC